MRGRLEKVPTLEFFGIFGIVERTYVRVGWRGDIEGIDLTEIETTTETKKIILTGNFFEFEENTIKKYLKKKVENFEIFEIFWFM